MNNQKRIVIVGATSAIAECCAREWVKEAAVDLTLIGRNLDKTNYVAEDLWVRSPQSIIRVIAADFIEPIAIRRQVDEVFAQGPVHTVLIAHGLLPEQSSCQEDLSLSHHALTVNGISPVLFAEAFAGYMQKAGSGSLAVISSVAGDRGRKSNYVYGAAKGMVTRYVQGLQHRLAGTGVKVSLIKPGPTDTPMTVHYKQQGMKMAKAADVAHLIVQGIQQGKSVIYAPKKWSLIMPIVSHLPDFIFNKLDI